MEKIKERILSYTKIPLILILPDKIDNKLKEDYINTVKESSYFYLVEENVNFCEMLKPITLIIGYSLEESSDTYILPVNSTKESFSDFLKNIFETEIEKNQNFQEKGFFKVFKKPDENSLKNEADSHFLTKNYIKAYEKYSNATNSFTNLHFQEMKLYSSLLLNEKLQTSFLFYKSFINTKRQFRIIDILILYLKIKEEFIFKIVQSVSLMKESEEKYYFIERLFYFRSNLASHLYYEYLVFVSKDRKYNEVKEYFDVFEDVLENNQDFLTERMKSFFKNIKEKSLCN